LGLSRCGMAGVTHPDMLDYVEQCQCDSLYKHF
jgi:hypothetical protein